MPVERRLSAILAADVVGYSGLMERDEAGTVERLKRVLAEVVEPAIAAHRGMIFKRMGDGLLAEFASAVEAVQAALDIQRALAARDGLQYRIGIHVGDVLLEGDDRLGDGVNIAARLQTLARPGGVALSGAAHEQVGGKVDCTFEDGGEHQVKNLSRPLHVFHATGAGEASVQPRRRIRLPRKALAGLAAVVVLAALATQWGPGRPVGRDAIPTVAVLPFDNLGGDAASGRLADGLTEDVINDLARYRDFAVVARNSSEVFKGEAVDVKEVARALDADFVLEGSIQHQSGTLRITAQLIDAGSGNHLWSEHWDRPDSDFFAVQEEIARVVGSQLGGGGSLIRAAGLTDARRKTPSSLSAYELYLLGGEKQGWGDPENQRAAVDLFKRAVAQDPGLARAWTALYHAYNVLAYSGVDAEENRALALAAAASAMKADPNDPAVHVVMGNVFGQQGDLARAQAEFDEALRLAPHSTEVMTQYASWAASFGDPAKGGMLADEVLALDPNLASWVAVSLSYAYYAADRYDDVLRVLGHAHPDEYTPDIWIVRSTSLAALGRMDEAAHWRAETLKRYPDLSIESWLNQPGYAPDERARFLKTMRLAGFPACAKPDKARDFSVYGRLPECK